MRKKFILIIITFIFFPFYLTAQNENKVIDTFSLETPFVYLYDGTLLLEDEFTITEKFELPRFRDKNGKKIKRKHVKFYQDESGYYGVYKKGGGFKPRVTSGTFDIFFKTEISRSLDPKNPEQSEDVYYYAKRFGDLRKITYYNLKEDLSVFPHSNTPELEKEVLDHLKLGRKRFRKRGFTIATGAILLVTGAVIYGSGTDDENRSIRRKLGFTVVVVGGAIGASAFLIPNPSDDYYNALITYNEYF